VDSRLNTVKLKLYWAETSRYISRTKRQLDKACKPRAAWQVNQIGSFHLTFINRPYKNSRKYRYEKKVPCNKNIFLDPTHMLKVLTLKVIMTSINGDLEKIPNRHKTIIKRRCFWVF